MLQLMVALLLPVKLGLVLLCAALVAPWPIVGKTAVQPAPQPRLADVQPAQAALARLQVAELAPPLLP